ncbi:MAG: protein-glutamate O-methyltransferase CheR [bacterium]|nr:protein-glutamate O-methyltransferase CheR [bacterium]
MNFESEYRKIICSLVSIKTGHDFSGYKEKTLARRIQRRMDIHQVATLDKYTAFVQQNRKEVDDLFNDLLIGVTAFFRNPEAFEVLKDCILFYIAKNIAGIDPASNIRVWVPGCSTGEEAYSIAILLAELMEEMNQIKEVKEMGCRFVVRVFATDLDSRSIDFARRALYPSTVSQDVSEERLSRFFVRREDQYEVKKEIRDMVFFSSHSLIQDASFPELDMVSCRNVLIYIEKDQQKKILGSFHDSLKKNGLLFLGSPETAARCDGFFSPLSLKAKIYEKKESITNEPGLSGGIGDSPLFFATSEKILQQEAVQTIVEETAVSRELCREDELKLSAEILEKRNEINRLTNDINEIIDSSEIWRLKCRTTMQS